MINVSRMPYSVQPGAPDEFASNSSRLSSPHSPGASCRQDLNWSSKDHLAYTISWLTAHCFFGNSTYFTVSIWFTSKLSGPKMATETIEPLFRGDTSKSTRGLLRIIILCTIAGAAVAARLFSVIRESTYLRVRSVNRFTDLPRI